MYYPMGVNLSFFRCLIVGGGKVAYQKVKELVAYGAKVTILSIEFCEEIQVLQKQITLVKGEYKEENIKNFQIVIAATNDKLCNEAIGEACKKQGKLCDVVTNSELSSFIVPASIHRGDLVISISTGGKSPALTKKIKQELDNLYDDSYSDYVALLGEWRTMIKQEVENEEERRKLLKALVYVDKDTLKNMSLKELSRNTIRFQQ